MSSRLPILLVPLLCAPGLAGAQADELTAAIPEQEPPWYELDASGRATGFAVEAFREIADRAGVEVRFEVLPGWTEIQQAVLEGRADLVPSLEITPERRGELAFSSPVEVFPLSVLVRSDAAALGSSGLEGRRVGAVEGNTAVPLLRDRPDVALTEFSDIEAAVFALLAGRLDAVAYPEPVLRSLLEELELENRFTFLPEPLAEIQRGIAVPLSRAALLERFEQPIDEFVGSDEYRALEERWFGGPVLSFWSPKRLALVGFGLLVAVILGMALWRYLTVLRINADLERVVRARELAEANYRSLFEHAADAILVADRDGHLMECNSAAEELLGYDQEELPGLTLDDLLTAEDRANDPAQIETLQRGGTVRRERRLRRADGTTVEVDTSVRPLPDGRILGIGRDLSERKQTAYALERRARFLRLLHSVTVHVNEAGSLDEVLEKTIPEVGRTIGWSVGHVYTPVKDGSKLVPTGIWWLQSDRFAQFHEITESTEFESGEGLPGRVLDSGRPEWIEDLAGGLRFAGSRLDQEVGLRSAFAAPVFVGPEPVAVLEFFHESRRPRDDELLDVMVQIGTQVGRAVERQRAEEEQRAAEARMRQGQKMAAIGRLAGGIAHDFNNLLTVILGQMEMTLSSTDDPEVRSDLEPVLAAAQRASGLTNQLLAFSRRQLVSPERLDLSSLLEGLEAMLSRLLGEDIRLSIELDSELWPVVADPGLVEQVVVNLAVNARDAMPSGGALTIRATNVEVAGEDPQLTDQVDPGAYVLLEVADTGVGIPPEIRELIFEPFFTTKGSERGTGLGLATCYGIVTQAGGVIQCSSEMGEGTTFSVLLPRGEKAAVPDARSATQKSSEASAGGGETILVVEDEPAVLRFVQRVLEDLGYRVHTADGADQARPLLNDTERDLDLLLTDVVLTGADGRQLAEETSRVRPELPVLFMTGYTDDVILQRGLARDEVEILQKPFSRRELAERVRGILGGVTEPATS